MKVQETQPRSSAGVRAYTAFKAFLLTMLFGLIVLLMFSHTLFGLLGNTSAEADSTENGMNNNQIVENQPDEDEPTLEPKPKRTERPTPTLAPTELPTEIPEPDPPTEIPSPEPLPDVTWDNAVVNVERTELTLFGTSELANATIQIGLDDNELVEVDVDEEGGWFVTMPLPENDGGAYQVSVDLLDEDGESVNQFVRGLIIPSE